MARPERAERGAGKARDLHDRDAHASLAAELAALPAPERAALFAELGDEGCARLLDDWRVWARSAQLPPVGDWRCWLILAGRGFGKTRAGAEWLRLEAERNGATRLALVGATMADARGVMVEGESGLIACAPSGFRPVFEPSRGRLVWPNGAQAFLYSAEAPEQLRGPQHHAAWADEIGKWPKGEAVWRNLALGLRLGERPRVVATTTPRPTALVKALLADAGTAVTRGRTIDNAANLPRAFIEGVTAAYGGTRLGRQELDGELIEDNAGALWRRAMIDRLRVANPPALARVVVAIDPPVSATGDACGLIAAGLGEDGHGYVLEDATLERAPPLVWAEAAVALAVRWRAERVIAEVNNGGDLVETVLRQAAPDLPYRAVRASRGKAARAEPVAALYEQGRVHHVCGMPMLEDQLCGLLPGGGYDGPGRSPDRADALVWALTTLMLGPSARPRVRGL